MTMAAFRFGATMISVCAAAAVMSACSAADRETQALPGASTPATANRDGSWMARGAAAQNLLYVTDTGVNDVYVYSYPTGLLVGTLTGFSFPLGVCVDGAGNVWIVNAGTSQLIEYAHGGTSPIATLTASGQIQYCAVSKRTGDIAAARSDLPNSSVFVWYGGTGAPQTFVPPNIYQMYYVSYDNKGDLYADGLANASSDTPAYAELAKGGSAFNTITLNTNPRFPGSIQFINGNLNAGGIASVESRGEGAIYQYSLSGGAGTQVGSSLLTDSDPSGAFFIRGNKVVWLNPGGENPNLGIYDYPAGGSAVKTIAVGPSFGVAISTLSGN